MVSKIFIGFFISAFLILLTLKHISPKTLNILGIHTYKSSYKIAIFGDSMVDTMGENLDYLQVSLKKRYPKITFHYYNYGIGSQNVAEGLARFHIPLNYKERNFPSMSQLLPDIIIIGSFAYNPFYPFDREKHWTNLSTLIQEAKNTGADVYVLAEIAPLRKDFGKGPNGVNWAEDTAEEHSKNIITLLENAIYLSKDHHKIPIINAYSKTKVNGKFGSKKYVDPNDGIHPSIEGHKLMAELIASTIKLK